MFALVVRLKWRVLADLRDGAGGVINYKLVIPNTFVCDADAHTHSEYQLEHVTEPYWNEPAHAFCNAQPDKSCIAII